MKMMRIDFNGETKVFQNPIKIISTYKLAEVVDKIREIISFNQQGYYVAGYLAYESATAFVDYYATLNDSDQQMPLLYFAVFKEYELVADCSCNYAEQNFNPELALDWQPSITYQQYQAKIAQIKQQIALGNTYQVNYTIPFSTKLTQDPLVYYLYLLQRQQAKFCAYLSFNNNHILSISPELFFKLENNIITTKPMKGTAARGYDLTSDLIEQAKLKQPKNQAENLMIVDLLRNDLSKISQAGSVQVNKLFEIEKYPTVWQLTSTIQSTLKENINLYDILVALFPSGSITGAPKASTMQIISQLETTARGVYCGTIGYLDPQGNAIFNIPIRTITIQDQVATYNVGGGITWDSTAEDEYSEIKNKMQILTNIQLPQQLLETMLVVEQKIYLLTEHLTRLQQSASYYDFQYDITDIQQQLTAAISGLDNDKYKLRLLLEQSGEIHIEITKIKHDYKLDQIKFAPTNINSKQAIYYHKLANREHYPKCQLGQEFILYNEHQQVTEFVNGNIVVNIDGEWLTPPIQVGLLAGVMRAEYLRQGKIKEAIILKNDLKRANKIAFINSVRGWIEIDLNICDL